MADDLTKKVIGCAIEVHRQLGAGLLESVYEECLAYELKSKGIDFQRQIKLPIKYKNMDIDCGYRMDIYVPGRLVIELKTVEYFLPIHQAQLLTYMRLSDVNKDLLINFYVPVLKDGIKRMVL